METIKLIITTKSGTRVKMPVNIERDRGRIEFLNAPYALKDEIKSMQGSKWHGYDEEPRQIWTVKDCERNNFQLAWMKGENPYARWEKPLQHWHYDRPLREHQRMMTDHMLTYHYCIIAADTGVGKSLSAIECVEKSGFTDWWWIAPKSGIAAAEREFIKWGFKTLPRLMTYDRLRIEMEDWDSGMPAPRGIICDESSRLKSGDAKRTKAVQALADSIRREHGDNGYVILMSGTPAPKSPVDWWSSCEIAWPGFLREGSPKAFEWRLAAFAKKKTNQGDFWRHETWRDSVDKCETCGKLKEDPCHEDEMFGGLCTFKPGIDEVSLLKERLTGLVLPILKKDCLKELPDMIFREIRLEPSKTIIRVAKALAQAAPTAIQGLTWLRELSDGFQYRELQDGVKECPSCRGAGECEVWLVDGEVYHDLSFDLTEGMEVSSAIDTCPVCGGDKVVPNMVRETKVLPTPKDDALKDLLDENDDQGRIVIFAGFQGSIDRITKLCLDMRWDVLQVDGRGWKVLLPDGQRADRQEKVLDHWANMDNRRVAFVAHPQSGGLGLTLTEACMAVFYSNDYSPESRSQAMARIHRIGTDINKGATIVDLFHLPTDEKVLNVLKANRRLERMTLEEFRGMVE